MAAVLLTSEVQPVSLCAHEWAQTEAHKDHSRRQNYIKIPFSATRWQQCYSPPRYSQYLCVLMSEHRLKHTKITVVTKTTKRYHFLPPGGSSVTHLRGRASISVCSWVSTDWSTQRSQSSPKLRKDTISCHQVAAVLLTSEVEPVSLCAHEWAQTEAHKDHSGRHESCRNDTETKTLKDIQSVENNYLNR